MNLPNLFKVALFSLLHTFLPFTNRIVLLRSSEINNQFIMLTLFTGSSLFFLITIPISFPIFFFVWFLFNLSNTGEQQGQLKFDSKVATPKPITQATRKTKI